jgi:hypothetical protein
MSFPPSRPLPRHRPLSANETAAVAAATVTACPAPGDVPDGIDRLRRAGGAWRRRQFGAVKNGARLG